jgi:small basic protein
VRPSQVVAGLAFLALVPLGIWLSYLGHERGLYPHLAIPVAFGVVVAVSILALFAALPWLRRRLE